MGFPMCVSFLGKDTMKTNPALSSLHFEQKQPTVLNCTGCGRERGAGAIFKIFVIFALSYHLITTPVPFQNIFGKNPSPFNYYCLFTFSKYAFHRDGN